MKIYSLMKYIIHSLSIVWAFLHLPALKADPASNGLLYSHSADLNSPYSQHITSSDNTSATPISFTHQPTTYLDDSLFNRSDDIGKLLYRTIENPKKTRNEAAGSALMYGLDSVGLGESVREGVEFFKKNTRYSFGQCGDLKLNPGQLSAASCMSDGGAIELNSKYGFDSVNLQFRWAL